MIKNILVAATAFILGALVQQHTKNGLPLPFLRRIPDLDDQK